MSQVRRWDSSPLSGVQATPQGGIRVPSTLTRVGVFEYDLGDNTKRRELRLPEEVFSDESLATLRGCTVTDGHPADFVKSDNWKAFAIGHVGDNVHTDATHVRADLLIQDAAAVARIVAGERKEISCGYTADLEMSSGVWNGEHYDAIQRTIRYNHVAIGPDGWGRAGSSVAMQLDSNDAPGVLRLDSTDGITRHTDGETTMKITIGGKEYTADSAEAKTAIKALEAKAARVDAAEASEKKAARAVLATNVRLLCKVHKLTIDEKEITGESGGSDVDLMRALLSQIDPMFDADNPSEEYVRGCIQAAIKNAGKVAITPEVEPVPDTATAPGVPDPNAPIGALPPAHDSVTARGRRVVVLRAVEGGKKNDTNREDADDEENGDEAHARMVKDQRERAMRKPSRS